MTPKEFQRYLLNFKLHENSSSTKKEELVLDGKSFSVFINEFWTAKQRQANSLHEVSYRACFKPQLPRFFIELFTAENEIVYDPFNGRGTTVIEAALLGRNVIANDVNPLSLILTRPRITIPSLKEIEKRLEEIELETVGNNANNDLDLSMFFHSRTLAEIISLKNYLNEKAEKGKEDNTDRWIRMVATNRLTGHSNGFFSVYTLPPNQAVSAERQKKINIQRNQKPEYRDIKKLILKKSKVLLNEVSNVRSKKTVAQFLNTDASKTSSIKNNSVSLTVTSPPFLDVVQYADDNWLRCWFNGIDMNDVSKKITMSKTLEDWSTKMQSVFNELYRITKPNGIVAFEVGEVRHGKIKLEEAVVPLGIQAGFACDALVINQQNFTKTANIWGVSNNKAGTNSNRIVVFRKV
ncbi:MAG: DNA methyltransferase [Bacteroidetes bacterium]|nr:DNA methyltransferase [Bacteroidota bacterium]